MRLGIVIGRIGGVDGVALETEKWIAVLRRLGHQVWVLTGEREADLPDCHVVRELAFTHPACVADQRDAFRGGGAPEEELRERLESMRAHLVAEIRAWIRRERIDVLIPENASTLPYHLAMGMALEEVLRTTGMPGLAHDHDFRWERGDRYVSPHPWVAAQVARCFPPALPNLRHAVINSNARDQLRRRLGVEATVVPNVMDFEAPFARKDAVNAAMLADLGLPPGAVAFFQVTRIVRRKGIEVAIELVHRMAHPRVHLVITGRADDDFSQDYLEELRAMAHRLGVAGAVHFAGERFDAVRRRQGGRQIYSLEDAYARAAAMTYFSSYEGFGNAFVEACLARVPILVNRYQPVYGPDIGAKGFCTIEIQEGRLDEAAVAEARRWVDDPARSAALAEHNFELGRRHFSYRVLEDLLARLLPA